jgi:hypothetical protein
MIVPALTGLSMVVLATTGPASGPSSTARMSLQQKNAAVQTFVVRATECVARKVAADPRFARLANPNEIGDLIVDSMPSCAELMRAMIESYDHYFGDGTGEVFFTGPYLDVLPTAVTKWVEDSSHEGVPASSAP